MGWVGQTWKKIPLFWRLAGPGLLLALAIAALLQGRPDGYLHLFFFPVGQGNAVLVVSPSGRAVLIDGGPDAAALLTALGRRLPFWQRELDLVLLTETAPERLAGPVAAVERYRPRAAGRPGRPRGGEGYARWLRGLERAGAAAAPLQQGARLDLGDGLIIEVLFPGAAPLPGTAAGGRDDALVLRLSYGGFRALLPTAAGPAGQSALLDGGAPLASTLLLLPRQGEERSLDGRFLQAVSPTLAVVSAGTARYEGSDARILEMVRAAGCALYRTDRQGTVEVTTDGEKVWVKTER